MRRFIVRFILVVLFFFPVLSVYAMYDPFYTDNNKYGIHIADTNDIPDIVGLVNSGGGDWGYVTFVIPDTDRNTQKWQEIYNQLRRNHLIPIVRIATHVENGSWAVPSKDDIHNWVSFLNSLNWPVENRYIILFNEPNHAKEWGNRIDPEGYADIASSLQIALKGSSDDFFILPAALDVSAANTGETMDAAVFWSRIKEFSPDFYRMFDGWNSHSYPNPGFSGLPGATGRGTLKSYIWELSVLGLNIKEKPIPVFITETGWQHSQGKETDNSYLTPDIVAGYFRYAAENVWNDPQIIAVTPFLFNYQDIPFDHFSWKMINSAGYYPMFNVYRDIPKIKGTPHQRQKYLIKDQLFPPVLVSDSEYLLEAKIENSGQDILDPENGYELVFSNEKNTMEMKSYDLPYLEPFESGTLRLVIKTGEKSKKEEIQVYIRSNGSNYQVGSKTISIVDPPSLQIHVNLGFRLKPIAENVKVNIFNRKNLLIHSFKGLKVDQGNILVGNLRNIIPNTFYKVEIIIPKYLPHTEFFAINENITYKEFPRFFPFDLNSDGKLTLNDFYYLFKIRPYDLIRLIY